MIVMAGSRNLEPWLTASFHASKLKGAPDRRAGTARRPLQAISAISDNIRGRLPILCARGSRLASAHAELSTSPDRRSHLVLHGGHRTATMLSGERSGSIGLAPERGRRASTIAIPHRCLGGPARPHARHLDTASGRQGFFHPMGSHQGGLFQKFGDVAHFSLAPRQWPVATQILGTPDSRYTGLQRSYGLCALQPGQARPRRSSERLAILEFSSRGSRRSISCGLGNCRATARRDS